MPARRQRREKKYSGTVESRHALQRSADEEEELDRAQKKGERAIKKTC